MTTYLLLNQYFLNNMGVTVLNKPKMVVRKQNSVLLNWEGVFESVPVNGMFRLQIIHEINGWTTIYWGRKKEFNVYPLRACTCYFFRLKLTGKCGESDWVEFKAATDEAPPNPQHMTRAVKYAKTSLLRKLINKRPILLDVENVDCKTPLIQACEKGDLLVATFLVHLGANVNKAILSIGRTALMVALHRGHLGIASMLLDKGAKKEMTDINGLSALHYAVDSDCLENVEFALEHNFDINLKDNKGWTPLLRAVVLDCRDKIIEILIKKGADVHVKDINGFDFNCHCVLADRNLAFMRMCA